MQGEAVSQQAKTWGPFTGRQISTVLCVLIVMLLLPVAAWSAAASHVILDTPVAANVGQRSQFISSGNQKLLPADGADLVVLTPPSGKGLVITDVKFAYASATTGAYVHLFVGAPACGTEAVTQEYEFPAGNGNMDSPFVPGYVVPPGKVLCAHTSGTVTAFVNAYGYIVAPGDARSPLLNPAAKTNLQHP
jgi:hypothetical protein